MRAPSARWESMAASATGIAGEGEPTRPSGSSEGQQSGRALPQAVDEGYPGEV